MALKPPSGKDLRSLRALADKIEQDDRYFQDRYGDPEPGSVRISNMADAKAIRAVLSFVSDFMRERK